MDYEEAKLIVEWASQAKTGDVAKYGVHEVLSALSVIILVHRELFKIKADRDT